jgi:hypothetical protein
MIKTREHKGLVWEQLAIGVVRESVTEAEILFHYPLVYFDVVLGHYRSLNKVLGLVLKLLQKVRVWRTV